MQLQMQLLIQSYVASHVASHAASSVVKCCHDILWAHLQARRYLTANPGQAEDASRNAAVAEQKLCGQPQRAGR